MEEEKINLGILLELGTKMHPHLGVDNHTNKLVNILFDAPEKLSTDDIFDLGKYYQRMLDMIHKEPEYKQVHAILTLKHKVYEIRGRSRG